MKKDRSEKRIRNDRFPLSLFFVYLVVLLLMSGIHTGLIVGMNQLGWSDLLQTIVPLLYWAGVAVGLTLFTRKQIQRVYEEPMHRFAEAAKQVASGDFSVYIPPLHTSDKLDYMDIMLEDFNKMVEDLGSIETLKTDFFSNVSHEIKTPLAVIQNNAELMRMEPLTIPPTAEAYDVCAQLAECALQFEDAWEQKALDFDADMEDRAEIAADPSLMELVWNNLFSNAVKFTEPGGNIILREVSDDANVYVSVCDTGCGMHEETKKHIFEKFYQGDTSHATAGNGLGLALAYRVLQLNNFQILVDSMPGEGSVFTVIMPRAGKGEEVQ